jgi:YD repeat-containing protein
MKLKRVELQSSAMAPGRGTVQKQFVDQDGAPGTRDHTLRWDEAARLVEVTDRATGIRGYVPEANISIMVPHPSEPHDAAPARTRR